MYDIARESILVMLTYRGFCQEARLKKSSLFARATGVRTPWISHAMRNSPVQRHDSVKGPSTHLRKDGSMFVRAHSRVKDGKEHVYYSIVESVRVRRGRSYQRQVLYLGELNATQVGAGPYTSRMNSPRRAVFPAAKIDQGTDDG